MKMTLLFLLLLVLIFPIEYAQAATYLKVLPTGVGKFGVRGPVTNPDSDSDTNIYYIFSDDVYCTLYNSGGNVAGTYVKHHVVGDGYGDGFDEENYGYIGVDMRMFIEYRIWPTAVTPTATQKFIATYRKNPSGNPWDNTDIATIPSDASVVSSGAPDFFEEDWVIPDFQIDYSTWGAINGTTGSGFDCGLYWLHPSKTASGWTNTTFYLDQLAIRVLAKYLVYDQTLETGYAGPSYQGTTTTAGATNVILLRLMMKTFSNTTISLNTLTFNLEGTSLTTADIAAVKLISDANKNGVYDAGVDTIIDTLTGLSSLTNLQFTGTPLLNNISHASSWFIAVDIADPISTNPLYLGVYIADETNFTLNGTVDEIVSNTARSATGVTDTLSPATLFPIRTGSDITTWVKVINRANVSAAVTETITTNPMFMGDTYTIHVTASNAAGCGDAINVVPVMPLTKGNVTGTPEAITNTVPIPQTIAAGANYTWNLFYQASYQGSMEVYTTVDYEDEANEITYNTGNTNSSSGITIDYAAIPILQVTSMNLTPTTASDDQPVSLAVTVKNVGTGIANNVTLYEQGTSNSWQFTKTGTANVSGTPSGPGGWAAQTLAIGAEYTWNFTFTPVAPTSGTLYYSVDVKDSGTASTTGNSNQIDLVNAGVIEVLTAVAPGGFYVIPKSNLVGYNSSFNVVLRVENTGGAAVEGVTPSTPTVTGIDAVSPLPTYASGPLPSSATIQPGEIKDFTFIFNSNASSVVGRVNILNGYAAGTDINSGYAKNTGATTDIFTHTGSYLTIDTNIHPKIDPAPILATSADTNPGINIMIAYDYNSNYYGVDGSGNISKFNLNGEKKWTSALPTSSPSGIYLPFGVYNDKTVLFIGTDSGRVYAVQNNDDTNSATGFTNWDNTLSLSFYSFSEGPVHGILNYGDYIYATSGGKAYCLQISNRQLIWTYNPGTSIEIISFPAIDNNYVYFGLSDGTVRACNIATGVEASTTGVISAGAQFRSPFVLNGALFALGENGIVVKCADSTNLSSKTTYASGAVGAGEPWVDFTGNYMWFTDGADGTGTSIYKVDVSPATPVAAAGWPKDITTLFGGVSLDVLADPLEIFDYVYIGGSDAGAGKAFVMNAADGTSAPGSWPFVGGAASGFLIPVSVDLFNDVFLLGSQDGDVYIFANP